MNWLTGLRSAACGALLSTMLLSSALAQGHYHYHGGSYVRHRNHYHYVPGHYHYHNNGGAYYSSPGVYGGGYVSQPQVVQTVSMQPQLISSSSVVVPQGSVPSGSPTDAPQFASPPLPNSSTSPGQASPGPLSETDALAEQLMAQANALCLTMHAHYRHSTGYDDAYRDAYGLLTSARHLHELEHWQLNRDKLVRVAQELDDDFHRFTNQIQGWHEAADFHQTKGIGRLATDLQAVEDTLHRFMSYVGVNPRSTVPTPPTPGLIESGSTTTSKIPSVPPLP
ncbi:hypothetical protein [Planctomicrobium piriforme]|uniref:Uncharacterized protein n=1 Tax=Planctomicrobium piriforme TaxID=1576369 RepID=A0A1I3G769_9PLAN|nr:hypothetical protein [Planctomicrobium piriforme]SFI19274.1 hypothetical protein SAMN05421753_106218 [Planctomicrobium piriforme]